MLHCVFSKLRTHDKRSGQSAKLYAAFSRKRPRILAQVGSCTVGGASLQGYCQRLKPNVNETRFHAGLKALLPPRPWLSLRRLVQ